MSRLRIFLVAVGMVFAVGVFEPFRVSAASNGLIIQQIGIAGDEFVVLQNISDTSLSLGDYWLQYFNNYDISAGGVTSSSYQLPSVQLAPDETIILISGTAENCGHAWVSETALSLKDSAGMLLLVQVHETGGLISYEAGDSASWSSALSGFTTAAEPKITGVSVATKPVWYFDVTDDIWLGGLWSEDNGCELEVEIGPGDEETVNLGSSSLLPPATILSVIGGSNNGLHIAAGNEGLAPPIVTEMLANPAAPQTDADDEFIELYNPNDKPFDLSWFQLETGKDSRRSYTFKSGEFVIKPKSFIAFSSSKTGLSLANSGGQARLLDPFGKVLSESGLYGTAKDGLVWALANGSWYWSVTATPGGPNIIQASGTGRGNDTDGTGTVEGTTTTGSGTVASPDGTINETQPTPLSPIALAGTGAAAVVYALYEYRHDIGNKLHQLRAYRAARRSIGPKP